MHLAGLAGILFNDFSGLRIQHLARDPACASQDPMLGARQLCRGGIRPSATAG